MGNASGGSSWKKKALIPLLAGAVGGTGYVGLKNPDTPVIGPAVTWIKDRVTTDFTKEGTYEVRIARLTLKTDGFKEGDKVNLRVLVLKRGEKDKTTEVWDSARLGETVRQVGRDPLSASWTTQPFLVPWKPGETYAIEVWDGSGMGSNKIYSCEAAPEEGKFPLRGKRKLKDRGGAESEGNSIDLVATRAKDA